MIDRELEEDKYSGSQWGSDGQLKILGHYKVRNPHDKYYSKFHVLYCSVCSLDEELFPTGSITSRINILKSGANPCNCSPPTLWKESQYRVLVKRVADSIGVVFLGWYGKYNKGKTALRMKCHTHGEYKTGTIRDFIARKDGCTVCRHVNTGNRVRKSDEHCINSFMSSGVFHPDTKFWRSERKDKHGHLRYWYVDCPDCGSIAEAIKSNLERGHKPCECTNRRQKEAYINLVCDNESVVAIKFGIAIDSNVRVIKQHRRSVYDIINYGIWQFPTTLECTQAERDCITQLRCGILSKLEVPDGHSETTYALNLEDVIDIYERNGGVRVYES